MSRQEVFWPDLTPIRRENVPARIGSYFISELNRNPYAVRSDSKPISVRDITSYVIENKTHKTKFGERNDDVMQQEVYAPWQVKKTPISSDVPDGLYEWLSGLEVNEFTIHEKIRELNKKGGLKYLHAIENYFKLIKGKELGISRQNFAIDILSLNADYYIEGDVDEDGKEIKNNSITLVGKFNEVRVNDANDSIIRIRQRKKDPSLSDAVNLSLNRMAYRANAAARGLNLPEPELLVFNLTNGRLKKLKTHPYSFDKSLINLIYYAHLAKKAGYIPEDKLEGIAEIDLKNNKPKGKDITIYKGKKKYQELTAKEAYEKAENIITRIMGDYPNTSRQFWFQKVG